MGVVGKREAIYVIMTCGKIGVDDKGCPDFGDTHLVGWYSDKTMAFDAVRENTCDINESCYPYAVIEAVKEGLYSPASTQDRWFFRYIHDKNKYEKISEPDGLEHLCGITMG